ncbi:MAG: glutathione S-transferase N-terminal domain-containing protein [Deltaproteobacteria bacterium]|nr:glutathione S-transferase N-terminal domain-containing protein [Deltaproteobacteria bacterium]
MIDLYTWTTPNGYKVSIMLEELGLPYAVHPVNLGADEQHRPEFLALNPNGKIPAIVDPDGPGGRLTVFESGAILMYLAEKTGRFLPREGAARARVLEWLMFQMSAVGPTFGNVYYFMAQAAEKVPYAIDRFVNETLRIVRVLDGELAHAEFLAGEYSIADVATYPWIAALLGAFSDRVGDAPHLRRWAAALGARPPVQRGMKVPAAG